MAVDTEPKPLTEQEVLKQMPSECCYTCKFWRVYLADREVVYWPGSWTGTCRFRAPVVPTQKGQSGWPKTSADQWCNEHKPRLGRVRADGDPG